MTDYGRDIDCADGLLPHMPTVTGQKALAQALYRRLVTKRGRVPWWPDYGTDIRDFLLSNATVPRIASAIEAEIQKDERVEAVRALVSMQQVDGQQTAVINVAVFAGTGTFEFVMSASQAAATLVSMTTSDGSGDLPSTAPDGVFDGTFDETFE